MTRVIVLAYLRDLMIRCSISADAKQWPIAVSAAKVILEHTDKEDEATEELGEVPEWAQSGSSQQ